MAKKTFTIFKSNSTEGNFFCEVRQVQLEEQNIHLPTQFNAWSYLSFFQNFWSLLKRIIFEMRTCCCGYGGRRSTDVAPVGMEGFGGWRLGGGWR